MSTQHHFRVARKPEVTEVSTLADLPLIVI